MGRSATLCRSARPHTPRGDRRCTRSWLVSAVELRLGKISAILTQDLVGLTEPAVLSLQGLELGGHVRGQARACARCLARPCQPIDAASAPCSRSSRQSKSPSPTARNDPSRARKPAEPQACALPAKIGSVPCLPSLHLLKVRSLRQTRSGSVRAHLQNFVDAYNFARRLKPS